MKGNMNLTESIKKILREFQFDELDRKPFRDGELVLEMVTGDEYPKYMIIYETGDLDAGDGEGEIIAELSSQFFDGHMAQTIMEYLLTR
tara:strand:+ start:5702 stop:5968 length:267 start_codon:yes stop_codon:yes gene_type:complete